MVPPSQHGFEESAPSKGWLLLILADEGQSDRLTEIRIGSNSASDETELRRLITCSCNSKKWIF